MSEAFNFNTLSRARDIVSGLWPVISADILRQWEEFTPQDIASINGDASRLSQALQSKYLLTLYKAEEIVARMADYYDSFAPTHRPTDIAPRARRYWTELTATDCHQIGTGRSSLVSIIAARYGLPRDSAWRQVNSFMRAQG